MEIGTSGESYEKMELLMYASPMTASVKHADHPAKFILIISAGLIGRK